MNRDKKEGEKRTAKRESKSGDGRRKEKGGCKPKAAVVAR